MEYIHYWSANHNGHSHFQQITHDTSYTGLRIWHQYNMLTKLFERKYNIIFNRIQSYYFLTFMNFSIYNLLHTLLDWPTLNEVTTIILFQNNFILELKSDEFEWYCPFVITYFIHFNSICNITNTVFLYIINWPTYIVICQIKYCILYIKTGWILSGNYKDKKRHIYYV